MNEEMTVIILPKGVYAVQRENGRRITAKRDVGVKDCGLRDAVRHCPGRGDANAQTKNNVAPDGGARHHGCGVLGNLGAASLTARAAMNSHRRDAWKPKE